jgi:hypothetical protein
MRRFLLSSLVILMTISVAAAQFRNDEGQRDTGSYLRSHQPLGIPANAISLLDPSRLHMSQSIQMGYYSIGGTSASRGMYLNTLTYDVSRPLSVTTHLGIQFQPSGPAEWNPANYGNQFVGGAELNWHPAQNFFMQVSAFRGMVPDYNRYGYYGWGTQGIFPYGLRP